MKKYFGSRSHSNDLKEKSLDNKSRSGTSTQVTSRLNLKLLQPRTPRVPKSRTDVDLEQKILYHIPCLFIKAKMPTQNILVYYHGNAEDISQSQKMLEFIQKYINVTLIFDTYWYIFLGQRTCFRISRIWGIFGSWNFRSSNERWCKRSLWMVDWGM